MRWTLVTEYLITRFCYRILRKLRQSLADSLETPTRGKNVSPEDFEQFLALLSLDTEEAAVLYTRLHKRLSGFFSMKGIADPQSAADETIDRAGLKAAAGAIVPEMDRYCLGFARNIVRERQRRMHREILAFQKYVESSNDFPVEQLERIDGLLKPCFEELSVDDQRLLLAYCRQIRGKARAEYRRQLAETMKMTVLALRVRVTRLRSGLTDCVRKRSNTI